jgi:hypothetical protein
VFERIKAIFGKPQKLHPGDLQVMRLHDGIVDFPRHRL